MPNELYIYGDIGVSYWGEDSVTDKDVLLALSEMPTAQDGLNIHINTFGGDVGMAMTMMNNIRAYARKQIALYPDFKLQSIVDGFAYSAGTILMLAADIRIMNPGSKAMTHNPLTFAYGNYKDFEKLAVEYKGHADYMAGLFATATGSSKEKWQGLMDDETFFTAEEAVKVGLATKAEEYKPLSPSKTDASFKLSNDSKLNLLVPSSVYRTNKDMLDKIATMGRGAYAKAMQIGRKNQEKNPEQRKVYNAEQLRLEMDCAIMVNDWN